MSNAWETTPDDVRIVLQRHNLVGLTDDFVQWCHDGLDHISIFDGVLRYTTMANQTKSMLADIECQLINDNIISGPRLFLLTDMDDED